jgi:4-methyl-5(b-hydroxyethyl)-thiazole monophosphate biosynthesis
MARILVPLAQGCEELEAVTIIDLLRRAGLEVICAGLEPGLVKASRGVTLQPDVLLDAVLDQTFDMVVLPGGLPGADNLDRDPRIHTLLQRVAGEQGFTAAICAAPRVLANAGLLQGRQATAYPGVLEGLQLTDVTRGTGAVVRDGRVITSRGPGTALDFALALIEALAGRQKRDEVEAGLAR